MKCKNHPEVDAVAKCSECKEAFCENCLLELNGKKYCEDCKIKAFSKPSLNRPPKETPFLHTMDDPAYGYATSSIKYGIAGFFFFGFILGPIAIYKAIKAKKLIKEMPELKGDIAATIGLGLGISNSLIWGGLIISVILSIL